MYLIEYSHEFGKCLHLHFAHHIAATHLDGNFADPEFACDLLVEQALYDKSRHVLFTGGECRPTLLQPCSRLLNGASTTIDLEAVMDGIEQILIAKRLREELDRPVLHCLDPHADIAVAGDYDCRQMPSKLMHMPRKSMPLWPGMRARTQLGTINHTLLSLEALRMRSVPVLGVAFIGESEPETEQIIAEMGKTRILGRLPSIKPLNREALRQSFVTAFFLGGGGEPLQSREPPVIVIALFYTADLNFIAFSGAALIVAALVALNRLGVMRLSTAKSTARHSVSVAASAPALSCARRSAAM